MNQPCRSKELAEASEREYSHVGAGMPPRATVSGRIRSAPSANRARPDAETAAFDERIARGRAPQELRRRSGHCCGGAPSPRGIAVGLLGRPALTGSVQVRPPNARGPGTGDVRRGFVMAEVPAVPVGPCPAPGRQARALTTSGTAGAARL